MTLCSETAQRGVKGRLYDRGRFVDAYALCDAVLRNYMGGLELIEL